MKSSKFQVGDAVQTISSVVAYARCSGVIKYRFYGIKFDGWYYVIQPNYAVSKEEGIVYAERVLELLSPSKFHKGQRVRIIKNGSTGYLGFYHLKIGKINCVIDMKTYYDYYVDVCGHPTMDCDSTIRCNEKELYSCCCPCHCC